MRFLILAGLLLLAGCIRPQINVCSTPDACPIGVCQANNSCNAKPLELKGLP